MAKKKVPSDGTDVKVRVKDAERLIWALKEVPLVGASSEAARERAIGFVAGMSQGDALRMQ